MAEPFRLPVSASGRHGYDQGTAGPLPPHPPGLASCLLQTVEKPLSVFCASAIHFEHVCTAIRDEVETQLVDFCC